MPVAPTPGESLGQLRVAFPKEPIHDDRFRLYLRELADIPHVVLHEACRELIRTRTFPTFPLVGEIRAVAARRLVQAPTEAAALAEVEAVLAHTRAGAEGDPPAVHPLTRAALDQAGGFAAFRVADEPGVVRGQFGRYYRQGVEAALRDAAVGDVRAHRQIEAA